LKPGLKAAAAPLVLLWLAAHAALLAVILAVKFLTAKTVLLLLLAGTAVWFLLGRKKTLALPAPTLTGNDAHA
jgi:hypothetical protein